MAIEMLERLQKDKLQGLESLVHSYEAVTDSGEDDATALADMFTEEGIALRQSCQRLWEHYWTKALAGRINDRQECGLRLRSLLNRAESVIRSFAEISRTFADRCGQPIARLALLEQQDQDYPGWVKACMARWEMLDRPRKPLQRVRIAESQSAYEQGQGEPISEVIARLEKGGEVVRE